MQASGNLLCMYSAVKKSSPCIEHLLSLSVFYERQLKASQTQLCGGLPLTDLIEFDIRGIRLGVGSAMLTVLQ